MTAQPTGHVIEVVYAGTRRRDRFEKPADYAAAGIAHRAGASADVVNLRKPFDVELRIRDITP
jgi:hypothetical protein